MLTSHSRLAIPYGAHRFSAMAGVPEPWSHRSSREDAPVELARLFTHPKPAQWGIAVDEAIEELPGRQGIGFADLIAALYRAYAKKDGKRMRLTWTVLPRRGD